MRDWLRTYGWKFLLALIVAAAALWFIVHLEQKASGTASVRAPAAQRAAAHAMP